MAALVLFGRPSSRQDKSLQEKKLRKDVAPYNFRQAQIGRQCQSTFCL